MSSSLASTPARRPLPPGTITPIPATGSGNSLPRRVSSRCVCGPRRTPDCPSSAADSPTWWAGRRLPQGTFASRNCGRAVRPCAAVSPRRAHASPPTLGRACMQLWPAGDILTTGFSPGRSSPVCATSYCRRRAVAAAFAGARNCIGTGRWRACSGEGSGRKKGPCSEGDCPRCGRTMRPVAGWTPPSRPAAETALRQRRYGVAQSPQGAPLARRPPISRRAETDRLCKSRLRRRPRSQNPWGTKIRSRVRTQKSPFAADSWLPS